MPVREISTSYEYVCDGCSNTISQPTKNRPKYWTTLSIGRDAYDYSGAAVADGSIHRILCGNCSTAVYTAMNAALAGQEKQ